MSTIALIACCKSKDTTLEFQEAGNLYTGQLFRAQLAYARQRLPDEGIYILSAKYGLVGLKQIIRPYEQTLNKMNMAERLVWAWDLDRAFSIHCPEAKTVWMLAGQAYRENLAELLEKRGIEVLRPHPAGLGYAHQVQWYREHVEVADGRGSYSNGEHA